MTLKPDHERWNRDSEEENELSNNHRHPDDAIVWAHTDTKEAIRIVPTDDQRKEFPDFEALHYLKDIPGRPVNSILLFRGESPQSICRRIQPWLDHSSHPSNLDLDSPVPDRALNSHDIKRSEIQHIASLKDWAHLVGADFYLGEKIGNTKESSGDVAYFSGNVRHGAGAYVSLASVHGPNSRSYLSIGTNPEGYYTVSGTGMPSRRRAIDIFSPQISYDGDTIVVNGKDNNTIEIQATTDNPDECIAKDS
jgi:hypothetical protein